jgi:hypothetical protein
MFPLKRCISVNEVTKMIPEDKLQFQIKAGEYGSESLAPTSETLDNNPPHGSTEVNSVVPVVGLKHERYRAGSPPPEQYCGNRHPRRVLPSWVDHWTLSTGRTEPEETSRLAGRRKATRINYGLKGKSQSFWLGWVIRVTKGPGEEEGAGRWKKRVGIKVMFT